MSWLSSFVRGASRRAPRRQLAQPRRPRLESLEDRCQPAFVGLGDAGQFAVLGLSNTGIHNINAVISGYAGVSDGGQLNNFSPSTILSDVYLCATSQYSGNGQFYGQLIVDAGLLSRANSAAQSAAQEAAALTTTQTFGGINQATTVTGSSGVNVIQVNGDVRASLTLSGTASSVFVVNVTGKLKLSGNSVLGMAGGVTADHVLYNFVGNGGTLETDSTNVVNGTLLGLSRTMHFNGVVNGEIIGGGGTIKLSNTHVNNVEFTLPTPAHVLSTVINGGAVQRSRVTDLTVTFDKTVSFATTAGAAFTLTRLSDNAAVSFTAATSTVNGQTIVTLANFTGSAAEYGSLADGRYLLTALSGQISTGGLALDGDNDGQAGGNYTFGEAQGLYRFFGDINGDRHVDVADFGMFTNTMFQSANYNAGFDFNGDGVIDIADFGQFSVRVFTNVP